MSFSKSSEREPQSGAMTRRAVLAGTMAVGAIVAGAGTARASTEPAAASSVASLATGAGDGTQDIFRRRIVHEIALRFPGWSTQIAAKGLFYFYPQAMAIHDDRLYVLYGGFKNDHSAGGSWISVHDWSNGAYLRGFHLDTASYGEGLVVKQEGTAIALYARYSATGDIGRWNITTLPSEGATLAVANTYQVGIYSQFTWSEHSDRWLIQKRDRGAIRHRYKRMKGDPAFEFDTDVHFDPAHMTSIAGHMIPLNVKAQGVAAWGSGYAVSYGGAFEFDQDVTPEKYCGTRIFTGAGDLVADGIMHPRKFADILTDAGATVGIIEGEGSAEYDGGLYAMWITQHWRDSGNHTGNYGIVITQEMVGDIDCSAAAAPGRLANIAPIAGEVAYEATGLRNPMSGATFTSLAEILEFMRDSALTRWKVYTTNSTLVDMDGAPIGSGLFMEIATGNFISWDVTLIGSTTYRKYWVITQSGYTGDVQQEAARYYVSATQWIGGGSTSPEGSVAAPAGCLWVRTNGELWVKASGTGNTGWIQK